MVVGAGVGDAVGDVRMVDIVVVELAVGGVTDADGVADALVVCVALATKITSTQ